MLAHFRGLNDKSTRLVLQYSLNRFDIDAEQFLQRYIELNPENEGVVMTMAEQLANSRKAEFIQQGRQEGIYEVAKICCKMVTPSTRCVASLVWTMTLWSNLIGKSGVNNSVPAFTLRHLYLLPEATVSVFPLALTSLH